MHLGDNNTLQKKWKSLKICIDPLFQEMLKIAPCNKNLVTSNMFRISQKCFPAKHGKSWISYDSNTVQNWITHHPKPKSPHVAPPLEDHWEDRPATDFPLLGSWSWSFLQNLLKHQEITLRIQRNKRNAGHKNVISILEGIRNLGGLQQGFSNQLTISRFSCFWSWAFLPMELNLSLEVSN